MRSICTMTGRDVKDYKFYVRRESGAFSIHQTLKLPNENTALQYAYSLVARYGGCDVWDAEKRVTLVLEPSEAERRN